MAMPASMHVGMGDHAAAESPDTAMPDGMPCCPDQAPASDCAKNCPLMAMCMSQFFQDGPMGTELLVPLAHASIVIPGNDPDLTGHLYGPPPRPPKTSV